MVMLATVAGLVGAGMVSSIIPDQAAGSRPKPIVGRYRIATGVCPVSLSVSYTVIDRLWVAIMTQDVSWSFHAHTRPCCALSVNEMVPVYAIRLGVYWQTSASNARRRRRRYRR